MPKRWDVTADNPELFAALISKTITERKREKEKRRKGELGLVPLLLLFSYPLCLRVIISYKSDWEYEIGKKRRYA